MKEIKGVVHPPAIYPYVSRLCALDGISLQLDPEEKTWILAHASYSQKLFFENNKIKALSLFRTCKN